MQVELIERGEATAIGLDNLAQIIRQGTFDRLFGAGGAAIIRWLDQERTVHDSETFVGLLCHAYREETGAKVRELEIAYGWVAQPVDTSWQW